MLTQDSKSSYSCYLARSIMEWKVEQLQLLPGQVDHVVDGGAASCYLARSIMEWMVDLS